MNYRWRFDITYDGTHYHGWQIQPHQRTIQEEIQKALTLITKEPCAVLGAGRTDQGVHACQQVAHCNTKNLLHPNSIKKSLNGILDKDIRILNIQQVTTSFHAQRSALSKIYHYYVTTTPVQSPFSRFHQVFLQNPINYTLLKEASNIFIGTHDFSSFANEQNKGASGKNPIRTIYSLDILNTKNGFCLAFFGNSFLYKMVRNITSLLIAVATEKIPFEMIKKIFEDKDRRKSTPPAPAKGLFLRKVFYSEEEYPENPQDLLLF